MLYKKKAISEMVYDYFFINTLISIHNIRFNCKMILICTWDTSDLVVGYNKIKYHCMLQGIKSSDPVQLANNLHRQIDKVFLILQGIITN